MPSLLQVLREAPMAPVSVATQRCHLAVSILYATTVGGYDQQAGERSQIPGPPRHPLCQLSTRPDDASPNDPPKTPSQLIIIAGRHPLSGPHSLAASCKISDYCSVPQQPRGESTC